jgi:hypothetical protein
MEGKADTGDCVGIPDCAVDRSFLSGLKFGERSSLLLEKPTIMREIVTMANSRKAEAK